MVVTDSPPDRDGTGRPARSATSAAERKRRERARKKVGIRIVTLELPPEISGWLIENQWLSAEDAKDTRKFVEELRDLLDCKVRGNFRPGPTRRTGTSTNS